MINKDLLVSSTGKTMDKLYPNTRGKLFSDSFYITRPEIADQSFDSFKSITNHMIVLECKDEQRTTLRGQLEFVEEFESIIFMGSPWFGSMEKVIEYKLSLKDFAYHDPMIDLLHVLKTQEITTEDLKHLLNTVNKQKSDLKIAAKEIEDIALFPTQNPDPLIRIDLDGKIMRQNPAADKLNFFKYNEKTYSPEDFWKFISTTLNLNDDRIIIDAESNQEIYSFVIKPLPESNYYNIYGRKVTEQKKNEIQLEILSSIAAQNTHGVVIADNEGKIEWANLSFLQMTGYSLEEIIGKKPGRLLQGPESDPETVAYLSNQISKGEPFICEILNYNKHKKPYWLRIQGQALRDKNGNISKYFAIEEDITEEKENQKKIQEFEDRFRMAFEKIGDYVWEHNFQNGETRFSQEQNHFIGLDTMDVNSNKNTWMQSILDEDRHLLENTYQNYISGKIDSHVLEYRMRDNNGAVKWVLDRGVVIEKDLMNNPIISIGTHTDITKQKTLELELGATANRLTSLIKNLYSGVLLENENRKIGLINQKFCDLFNIPVSPEILIGSDCSQAAVQSKHLFKNPEEFVSRIDKILTDKEIVINEHIEMINGKYLQRDFIPIWNEGVYTGHLWLYTDITEKINAEDKLEKQRIFYEQILNNTPADIAVFDSEHRYLFLNPQAVSNPELRAWMIGKKDEDYIKHKNLSKALISKRKEIFNTAIKTKKLHSFEEEIIKPDGMRKYILRNFYPVLNDEGNVELVVGYGVDITNIKEIQHQIEQSEKKYRDVIENSLALITTHDLEGNFISVNPIVGKTYGYKNDEIIGHSITEFLSDSDKKLFKERYLKTIKTKKQDSGIFRVRSKSGKTVYTLYNNFLKEEPGMEPYVIGFAVDISDRIQAEKELKLAKKATEELAEVKQNFLANMSHEIRTPMNAIIGMSSQLTKTGLTQRQELYLKTINNAAENLLVIINDILDLSKVEAGKLSIEEIAFKPKIVIQNAMQVMMLKAEEKGIKLTNSFCDSKLSDVLIGDPHRLNQILLNLLSNAIKFTEKGSVDVTCEVLHDTENSQIVRARVIDTGIGMDNEFVKNPFQKFNQEDVSISRKYGGTGLGMRITQSLLQLMGGSINVVSKKNEGTIVSFELEMKKGRPEDLLTKDILQIDTSQLIGRRILVVDDNEMNRLVASTILQNYKVVVFEAENGKDAIGKVSKVNPELILMDLQMPIMNGLEATSEIRKSGNNVPIIALTANAIKGENEKCFNAGMNDYISKPYKENELIQKLSNWLVKKISPNKIEPLKETINIDEDSQTLYNLADLEEIGRGNKEFISKMVNVFCTQTPEIVEEMLTAFKSADYTLMGKLAHKMKPSIENLKITSIIQDVKTIEKAGKNGQINAETATLLLKIEKTIHSVIQRMKQDHSEYFNNS